MADQLLIEKWADLIEAENVSSPEDINKKNLAQLLENQSIDLKENASVQADMGQYTPILVPAVRRIFPQLLANEIVGVQSLSAPTGYAYALRYGYTGVSGDSSNFNGVSNSNADRGTFNRDLTGADAKFYSFAILASDPTFTFAATASVGTNTVAVLYSEPGKALVTAPATAQDIATFQTAFSVGATGTSGSAFTIVAAFQNEAGYNLIFKNYTGPVTTANGETLGANIKSMGITVERVAVTAQSRRLKAEYTVELAQDLKAVHGLDAEKELINILEYEITAELDRELVDLINAKAATTRAWTYGSNFTSGASGAISGNTADGRWENEKFRTLYNRILREANIIALTSRRGMANFIIASSNVVAALETLSGFMYAAVPGSVKPSFGVAKVGTLDGRFTVYMDTFAMKDYVTLGYKGTSAFDSGIIYCPYVPLMLQKVVDPTTFQPKIAFLTRDAITANLYGVSNYYRTMNVDFTGSSLGGNYWGNW